MAHTDVPPVMMNPSLLAPGDSWTHVCNLRSYGRDAAGRERTLTCGLKTQGGLEGLKAHIRTVHADSRTLTLEA